MSKEIILKIRDAEAQADRIRSEAQEDAKARVRRAEEDGKKLCDSAEANSTKENAEKLALARKRADAVMDKAREDISAQAETMREGAEFNMREAVRLIIAGVNEQCQ